MKTYGIMQGRLSPPEDARFQSFPRNSWREEIARAREAGLDYIEWVFDEYGRTANPIENAAGIAELIDLKARYNIATPALCGDWLMDFPLLRCTESQRNQREQTLHGLLRKAAQIGANRMVLPFVDISKIETEADKDIVISVLQRALPAVEKNHVEMHLETDLGPTDFAALMARIPHPMVKVNYDSGNSSGLGYIAREEFAAYGDRIGSIHIKDRYRKPGGGVETRPLGEGSANFEDLFASMKKIGYSGGVTLQVARGADGDEVNFTKQQLAFVKQYWQ